MNRRQSEKLRQRLESVHAEFVRSGEIHNDALAPALRYQDPRDQEFAAFVCAVFAYGKVAQIIKSLDAIFSVLGDEPVETILNESTKGLRQRFQGWKHRFNDQDDLVCLLSLLAHVYRHHDGIEEFVGPKPGEGAYQVLERLVRTTENLRGKKGLNIPSKGSSFWYLLPRPSDGSACKRLNLFLRWMAGRSEMDLGLWTTLDRRNLIIPVDTHVLQQSQKLGLTERKTADWKTAEQITDRLRILDPDDPTRFDFAICHIGIRQVSL